MKPRTYRGIFRRADRTQVALDFYADNRGLALDHAAHVADGAQLTLVRVTALRPSDVFDTGSFYPLPEPRPTVL